MTEKSFWKMPVGGGLRVLASLACVVLIVAGLKASARLFVPVMLGVFFAMLSLPILNWLSARGLPRMIAVITTVLVDLLFLFVIVFLLSGVIGDLQSKSTEYAERLRKQAAAFSESMDRQLERFGSFWSRAGLNSGENSLDPAKSGEKAPPAFGPKPAEEGREAIGLAPEMAVFLDTSIPTFRELFERYWDSNRIVGMIGEIDAV